MMGRDYTMVWVGMWHGGVNYSAGYAEDAEVFRTIRTAAEAMRFRRDMGHHYPQTFRYVFREDARDLTPCAHSDNSGNMWLWGPFRELPTPDEIRAMIETVPADRVIEIGPRGGIVVSRG